MSSRKIKVKAESDFDIGSVDNRIHRDQSDVMSKSANSNIHETLKLPIFKQNLRYV